MVNDRYYKLLNLNKSDNPSETIIKKAYRKQALKWHPDRNLKNKQVAEEKFKEINDAYSILSDKRKKDIYDLYGESVLNNNDVDMSGSYPQYESFTNAFPSSMFSGTGNVEFMFNAMNEGSNTNSSIFDNIFKTQPNVIQDVKHDLHVSLEDLCNGVVKKIKITFSDNYVKVFNVNIKPGWKTGTKLSFKSKNKYTVVFTIIEVPHKYYIRDGNNLKWNCILTQSQANKNIKITLPAIYKNDIVEIETKDKNIVDGYVMTLDNKGMSIKNSEIRGNLLIKFLIK